MLSGPAQTNEEVKFNYLCGLMIAHREANLAVLKHRKTDSFLHRNHARKVRLEIENSLCRYVPPKFIKEIIPKNILLWLEK
jgi:translation initiation factor 2B subunit (eIF-2B alpha/beta/delta family)